MTQIMILTGCASGIGKHMAATLYRKGHRLVLTDVNESGLRAAADAEGMTDRERVVLQPLDVRRAEAWDDLVKSTMQRWGRIDVLMNIAGVLVPVWAKSWYG